MRALIATAGLIALAGGAAASPSQPQTLRRSATRIAAVAQDGKLVAWLAEGGTKCNAVHILTAAGTDLLPQPAASSMTCHWDLSDGRPQLGLAAARSLALWTLHLGGSSPFDYVMAAQAGGQEVVLDRLGHASDGTGHWLGGVAAAGTTLAYSTIDVEYADKLGCLAGGPCRREIAGGGIQTYSGLPNGAARRGPVPGAGAALELAAGGGRLAYVAATGVNAAGAPVTKASAPVWVVEPASGTVVSWVKPHAVALAIALSPHVLAVLGRNGRRETIRWYSVGTGARLGSVAVPSRTASELAVDDRLIVFRVGPRLRGIALRSRRVRTLTKVTGAPVGLSLRQGRLVWAENRGGHGRIRMLAVP